MAHCPSLCDSGWLENLIGDPHETQMWTQKFDAIYHRQKGFLGHGLDLWLLGAKFSHGSSCPQSRRQHRFGPAATHTHDTSSFLATLSADDLEFPLRHPELVLRHHQADRATHVRLYGPAIRPIPQRRRRKKKKWYAKLTISSRARPSTL